MHAEIHQIESEFAKFTCSALNLQIETGTQRCIAFGKLSIVYSFKKWKKVRLKMWTSKQVNISVS